MQVWLNGQFVAVEVHDRQDVWNACSYPVQLGDRMEAVAVAREVVAKAQQYGHERDLYVLVARSAASAMARPGTQLPAVSDAELQQLWTLAGQGQIEKVAAQTLGLLLAARHRQRQLDVFSIAASLKRSVWEVLHALRLLHDYGAAVYVHGGVPDAADNSVQAGRNLVRLGSDPPDVARLVAFAEALGRSTDGLGR